MTLVISHEAGRLEGTLMRNLVCGTFRTRAYSRSTDRVCLGLALAAVFAACRGATDPVKLPAITGNAALQFSLAGEPSIARSADTDSQLLIVTIPVTDSVAHVLWVPTLVSLSSDETPAREYSAVPFACLRPQQTPLGFPYNFSWNSCNAVGVRTDRTPSPQELSQLASAASGVVVWRKDAASGPGMFLVLRVPTGESAVAEAARRASMFSFVIDATEISDDPICVRSDVVPPPECPPWHLALQVPFSHGMAGGDTIIVAPGGVVRLRYLDALGEEHFASAVIP